LAATFEARGGKGGQGKVDKPGGAGGDVRVLGGELVLRPGANIDLAGGAGSPAGADGSMVLDGGTLVLDGVGLDEALVCGTFDWAAGTVRFPQDLTVDSDSVAGIPMGLPLGRRLQVGHAMTIAPGGSLEVSGGGGEHRHRCRGPAPRPVPD